MQHLLEIVESSFIKSNFSCKIFEVIKLTVGISNVHTLINSCLKLKKSTFYVRLIFGDDNKEKRQYKRMKIKYENQKNMKIKHEDEKNIKIKYENTKI